MAKREEKLFQPGIHIPDKKELSREKAIEDYTKPEKVYISVSQGIGAPSVPIVSVGDKVKKGQKIADAGGFVSAPLYSSISGEVKEVTDLVNGMSVKEKYIVIENDFTEEETTLQPLAEKTPQAIVERVREAGIVGLGGAGFPTAIKLTPKTTVDALILNGAECEPYLNCDFRLMIEHSNEIAEGAKLIAKALNITKIKIGIEENKPEAIEIFKKIEGIDVVSLKKKYPQGAEKSLIWVTMKRKVPSGKMPFDVGCVVQNVATCYAVYEAVEKNKPLYERVVSVTGGGVVEPKNLLIRNGTSIKDIIDYCGGMKDETVKVIKGGPMMGRAMHTVYGWTKKMDSGILVLTSSEANLREPSSCINCGRCAKACSMHLMPMYIDYFSLAGNFEKSKLYGLMNCVECGCCAYVCPAKRPLVESIQRAKAKFRELDSKKR